MLKRPKSVMKLAGFSFEAGVVEVRCLPTSFEVLSAFFWPFADFMGTSGLSILLAAAFLALALAFAFGDLGFGGVRMSPARFTPAPTMLE